MNIYIASDHAAFDKKNELIKYLSDFGSVVDLGTNSSDSVHYPNFAKEVCQKVSQDNNSFGILLCGTGIGMSMVANRYKNIRAGLCRTNEETKLTREHNNANILCLGGRVNSLEEIKSMSKTFLTTEFEGGRHQARIDMFNNLGSEV